jgi:membrane associated rhomboid family serine protease
MRGSEGTSLGFHRPTKAVLGLMLLVLTIWLVFAIGINWGSASEELFFLLAGNTERILHGEVWRLVTAPLLHYPQGGAGVSHLLSALLGLYFFTPRLEEAWGSPKLLRFIALSAIIAYTLQMAVELALPASLAQRLVPMGWFGLMPALEAIAIAWALTFKNERVLLFFVLPVTSRMLIIWVMGMSTLYLIAAAQNFQGLISPFGGMLCGWLLGGGNPSPLRKAWLKLKLAHLDNEVKREQQKKRRPNPAGLRAIPGGRSDDDDDRGPDGRFLN